MERKKKSIAERKLKRKIILALASLSGFLIPFLAVILLAVGIAPSAGETAVAAYKEAAETAGCSWQELLAFDTVRYENDFDEADPFQSAMEFLSIYYEEYREEEVEGENGTRIIWVMEKSGWLNTPDEIRGYFDLPSDADVNSVAEALKNYTKPQYLISVNAKDIEDVMEAHAFDQEQTEWAGALLAEGLLSEMFGEEYDLPEFITAGSGYFGWPIPGWNSVSSPFGVRIHPVTGVRSTHYGVDIPAPEGTPVVSIEDGVVTGTSFYGGTAGINVKIRHEKDGYVWESKYFHLSQIKVSVGDAVSRGTVIAASGNTGRSSGPHLHIGITMNGTYVDPLPMITE